MMTVRLRRWLRWRWLRWRWRWRCPSRWRNSTCCDILVPRPTGVSQGCKHLCQIKKGCQYSEWLLWQLCHNQIYMIVSVTLIWLYQVYCAGSRDSIYQKFSTRKKNGTWWKWVIMKCLRLESGTQACKKNRCRESTVPKIRCACENAEIFVICCHFLRFGRVLLFPNFQTDGQQNIVLLSLSEV